MELTNQELKQVTGGGLSLGTLALIGAGVVFLIGVFDGFLRPFTCR